MKFRGKLQKAAFVVSGYILGILVTATSITWANADTISASLNQPNYMTVRDPDAKRPAAEDLELYKSDYKSIKEVVYNGFQVQEEEQKEGTVLLENKDNALPLAKGSNVSVFGITGALPFYGASGSGGINQKEAIGWYDAFRGYAHSNPDAPAENVKGDTLLNINESLATDYTNWSDKKNAANESYLPASSAAEVNIGDVPWATVQTSDGYKQVNQYGDAAIYIIKRTGGEGYDLPATSGSNEQYGNVGNAVVSQNDGTDGDYLQLSPTEKGVLEGLKQLKEKGTIKKIILILNMASPIQLDFLKDDTYSIDATVWTGSVGEVGTVAVAKLLTGEYNFSGHAAMTLWTDNLKNPVNNNFMDQNYYFTYPNYAEYGLINPAHDEQYQSTFHTYTVYQEGMYLGYKYTETRYEDYVMGTENVGDFNYEDVVAYPFGYGQSYSTFEFSDMKVSHSDDKYTVSLTVTNTSDVAGKTPVQIYIAKPYGDYAKDNDIQVPSVELIDFGKTEEIAAHQSTTISIDVDEKWFTTYDTFGAETYVIMPGDYYLIAAQDAHEAVNSLLAAKGYGDSSKLVGEGDADLTYKINRGEDTETYSVSSETGMPITNSFDFVDINTYEGRGDNHVDYYSRDNWNAIQLPERKEDGTLVKHHAELELTDQMVTEMRDQMDCAKVIEKGGEYPLFGQQNGLTLKAVADQHPSYDSPVWDDLLEQMTWDETVDLLSNGRHKTQAIASIAKPATSDENGPNGFNSANYNYASAGSNWSGPTNPYAERAGGYDGDKVDENGNSVYIPDPDIENGYTLTGFSSNGVLAATFNREIAAKVGKQIGNEGIWGGMSGLLGLGMNIIRSPYAGRTAEYYSEDAMLTGLICVPEIQEIEKRGVHCFIKHCAMNECETARHGVNTWCSEQAMRENYLRAFEIGIEEGGSYNVMTSFSRMGVIAVASCDVFTKNFLRNECGLPGIVETDCAGDMTDGAHGEAYVSRICNIYTGATDLNEYNYSVGAPDYTGSSYTFDDFAPTSEGGSGEYGNLAQAMREACKRIVYAVSTTNAMNGITSDTHVVRLTPAWQKWIIAGDSVFGVLFVGSIAWVVVTQILDYRKKKQAN